MKKRILSAVLVSGITLAATSVTVHADDYDSKISAQDTIINNLTQEQAAAQSKVVAIQSQVTALQEQRSVLEAENAKLEIESQQLSSEIQALSKKIVARNQALKKQARTAQKNSNGLSYMNTIFNAKSISEAVNRVIAVNKIVSANSNILEQQKSDKAAIEAKQVANQEAINTLSANRAELEENENALATQRANLEVAQLDLSAQLAQAEDTKAELVSQKAVAEEAARQAAEKQAAAEEAARQEAEEQAKSVAQAQAAVSNGTAVVSTVTETTPETVSQASTTSASTSTSTATSTTAAVETVAVKQTVSKPVATTAVVTPSATTATTSTKIVPVVSSTSNSYPVGQCTWGVKSLAPWVGNYWGNAGQWIASAQAAGFSVGTTPVAGAVAVWPYDGGGYGHVAYVTSVSSSTAIQVMESNYAGSQSIGNYRGTFNPTASTWGGGTVYYIYPN